MIDGYVQFYVVKVHSVMYLLLGGPFEINMRIGRLEVN